jgi:hypothetical protein
LFQFEQTFPAKAILVPFLNMVLFIVCKYDSKTLAVGYIPAFAFEASFAAGTGFFFVFVHVDLLKIGVPRLELSNS